MAIKVLVVDDSLVFRRMLSEFLDEDPDIEVVAMAADPYQARDMIIRFNPDVMTLDIEMPRMNGIDFMKKLIPQHPMKVIMISSMEHKVLDYIEYGAVDYVQKPHDMDSEEMRKWVFSELITKVKTAYNIKYSEVKKQQVAATPNNINRQYHNKIVAIGASTGGTEAILAVIKKFYPNIPGTVIVAVELSVLLHSGFLLQALSLYPAVLFCLFQPLQAFLRLFLSYYTKIRFPKP